MAKDKVIGSFDMDGTSFDFSDKPLEDTPETVVEETVVDPQKDIQEEINRVALEKENNAKLEEERIKILSKNIKNEQEDVVEDESPKINPIKVIFDELKEKGILDIPDEFTGESDEEVYKVWEDNKIKGAQSIFEQTFENHPQADKAKALFEYIKNNGDIDKFTEAYANPLAFIDLTNEKDQERVAKIGMKTFTRLSDERIDDQIQKLKDGALLEDFSKDYFDQLSQIQEENKTKVLAQAQEENERSRKERAGIQNEIREFINKNENIKGFINIKSKKDKQSLEDYILKPTVKLGNQLVPKMVADDANQTVDEFLAIQALRSAGFDFKSFAQEIETKTKGSIFQKISDLSKQGAKIQGTGKVNESDVMKGKDLSQYEKDKLWKAVSEKQII